MGKKKPKSTVNNNWLNLKSYNQWRVLEAIGLVTKSHDQQKQSHGPQEFDLKRKIKKNQSYPNWESL